MHGVGGVTLAGDGEPSLDAITVKACDRAERVAGGVRVAARVLRLDGHEAPIAMSLHPVAAKVAAGEPTQGAILDDAVKAPAEGAVGKGGVHGRPRCDVMRRRSA